MESVFGVVWGFFFGAAYPVSEGGAVDSDGCTAMLEAVEKCVNQRFVLEKRVPVGEIQVCSDMPIRLPQEVVFEV